MNAIFLGLMLCYAYKTVGAWGIMVMPLIVVLTIVWNQESMLYQKIVQSRDTPSRFRGVTVAPSGEPVLGELQVRYCAPPAPLLLPGPVLRPAPTPRPRLPRSVPLTDHRSLAVGRASRRRTGRRSRCKGVTARAS